ncbi:VanZ family protein [Actinoplanes sp. TRM 88003]|uniref:VanZ family protein n=1 Tax=Paractinoplanes aksuensis TaxID=2939490 RepID=A0ABT1E483_9ACTN|nr:VanZ family protein [Actinoplanes aksuensis]MCO8277936.1 VanZ family protein [Actinoplanes aksuensis]
MKLSAAPRPFVFLGSAVLVLAGVLFALLFPLRRMLLMSAPRCLGGHWHGCYDTENGVVLMTLVGLPVAALAAWALARRHGWRRSVATVGLVYGTVPMVWLTLMPGVGAGLVPGRVSLVPLADLPTMGPIGIGGNLLILAALGFFGPIRFAALASVPRILIVAAGCSALIEISQYVFRLDRVSSIDDVLINTTGAVLAALASRRWWATRAGADPVVTGRPTVPARPGSAGGAGAGTAGPESAPAPAGPAAPLPGPAPAAPRRR